VKSVKRKDLEHTELGRIYGRMEAAYFLGSREYENKRLETLRSVPFGVNRRREG